MLVEGTVTAAAFKQFLERLIVGHSKKIFLIVDGHPTHKAKLIKSFLEKHSEQIELFFLPPYSPELNPDELVWAHLKKNIGRRVSQTKEELKANAYRHLQSIQKLPELVKSFFQHPTCRYAL